MSRFAAYPSDLINPYETWSSDESSVSASMSLDTLRTPSPATPEDFPLLPAYIQPSPGYEPRPSHFLSHHGHDSSPTRHTDPSYRSPSPVYLSLPPVFPLQPASPPPIDHPTIVSLHLTATTTSQVDISDNGTPRTRPTRKAALQSQKKTRDIQLQTVDVESDAECERFIPRKRRASDVDDEFRMDQNVNRKGRNKRKALEQDSEKQCSLCSEILTRDSDCRRHMASVHRTGPTFKCLLCDKNTEFTRKDSLKRHWKSQHKTELTCEGFDRQHVKIDPPTLKIKKGESECMNTKGVAINVRSR